MEMTQEVTSSTPIIRFATSKNPSRFKRIARRVHSFKVIFLIPWGSCETSFYSVNKLIAVIGSNAKGPSKSVTKNNLSVWKFRLCFAFFNIQVTIFEGPHMIATLHTYIAIVVADAAATNSPWEKSERSLSAEVLDNKRHSIIPAIIYSEGEHNNNNFWKRKEEDQTKELNNVRGNVPYREEGCNIITTQNQRLCVSSSSRPRTRKEAFIKVKSQNNLRQGVGIVGCMSIWRGRNFHARENPTYLTF